MAEVADKRTDTGGIFPLAEDATPYRQLCDAGLVGIQRFAAFDLRRN